MIELSCIASQSYLSKNNSSHENNNQAWLQTKQIPMKEKSNASEIQMKDREINIKQTNLLRINKWNQDSERKWKLNESTAN